MNARQMQARLKELNANYHREHVRIHAEYNRAFDAALRRHNITMGSNLIDVHSFPDAFHQDTALVAAKAAFHDAIGENRRSREAGVAKLPKPQLQIIRTFSKQ